MKKNLLFFFVTVFFVQALNAQLIYDNSTPITTGNPKGTNPGLGSSETPAIIFEDADIPQTTANADSTFITQVVFGIYRKANAPATTVNFYYTVVDDTATLFKNLIQLPPVSIGTINLAANGSTAGVTTETFGDGINPLFRTSTKIGPIGGTYQTIFFGMSFSDASASNGFAITQNISPNVDAFWVYDADAEDTLQREAYYYGGSPFACYYLQVYGFYQNALPVRFTNFDGIIRNNQTLLTWTTSSEKNNKGFEVERSNDGQTFSSIGFVAGKGTTSNSNTYTYSDDKLVSGNNYYRLKQIDLDGKFNYSSTIKLEFSKFDWAILGNGSANKWMQLQLDKQSNVSVQIVSLSGKVMQTINKGTLDKGTYSIPLDMSNVSAGMYVVRLIVNNQNFSKNIIK